jgi:dienelactone hydrolase
MMRGQGRLLAAAALIGLVWTGVAIAAPEGAADNRGGSSSSGTAPRGTPPPGPGLDGLQLMIGRTAAGLAAANALTELIGSGPYPAMLERDLALPNATIYRPAALGEIGKRKLGVVIWGNGGCTDDGASARAHLAEIASHGYLVIAPGRPQSAPGAAGGGPAALPMKITIQDLRDALDWVLAENGRPGSPYHGRIDRTAIAAAGHSCGGMLAILLGDDPRVRTVLVHNSGTVPVLPDMPPLVMHKERVKGLHGSVLFLVGGPRDVMWPNANIAYDDVAAIPAFFASRDLGHGGTFDQPHGGEVAAIAVDWLDWQLRHDRHAAARFVGSQCGLCTSPAWTVRKKNIG